MALQTLNFKLYISKKFKEQFMMLILVRDS